MKQRQSAWPTTGQDPQKTLTKFLDQLDAISNSPDMLEFCTPGHRAGRGFGIFLAQATSQPQLKQDNKEGT
jgi:hypothetical protein